MYDIRIFGRVQGVGFRFAARSHARSLNLKGWVENYPDGTVHAVIYGQQVACMEFYQWCKNGTGYSWVEKVEIKEIGDNNEKGPRGFNSFEIR